MFQLGGRASSQMYLVRTDFVNAASAETASWEGEKGLTFFRSRLPKAACDNLIITSKDYGYSELCFMESIGLDS